MSENVSEQTAGIDDDQLPEDLQPSEDNPLAEPLDETVDTKELDMEGGKAADQSGDPDDSGDAGASGDSGAADQDG